MPVRFSSPETEVVVSSSGPPAPSSRLDQTNPLIYDDDEVLQEIDVFLSPALAHQMHLLQYPLTQFQSRTAAAAAADSSSSSSSVNMPIFPTLANPSDARIKAQHGKIEIDIPLPPNMERDGSFPLVGDRTFQSQTIPIQTHLCFGKMIQSSSLGNPELHLVPLSHMKQMRPSFEHINVEDQRTSTNLGNNDMDYTEKDESKSKPVLFQRKESDRAANARKSSYAFKKSSEESEEWTSLMVCLPRSAEHKEVMNQVYCTQRNQQVLSQNTPQSTYVQSLHYISDGGAVDTTTNIADKQSQQSSFVGNDIKSIVARVTSHMLGGGPIPYSVIRANFDMTVVAEEHLLKALSVVAVMVRGHFCLHTKFLSSNLPPDLARARTFILLLLHREGSIERPRLDTTRIGNIKKDARGKTVGMPVSLSSERWLVILKHVAKQTSQGLWVLKLEDDTEFEERFPKQASLYEQYWRRQEERFKDALDKYHHDEIIVM